MPRQHRIHYPGAIEQVMERGNRRENIVHDDADREMLLATLAQSCQAMVVNDRPLTLS